MHDTNVFSEVFRLPRNQRFLIFGFWLAFGVFQSVFLVFPIFFSPPKFLKFNEERNSYESVSLIFACEHQSDVIIDSNSRNNLALENNLYCGKRYIADSITGFSMIGSLIVLVSKLLYRIDPDKKIKSILLINIIWSICIFTLILSSNLFVIALCLISNTFFYSFQMSEILDFNVSKAPRQHVKAINSSCWVFFAGGSTFSLGLAYAFGSNWRVYYAINCLYIVFSTYFISIGSYPESNSPQHSLSPLLEPNEEANDNTTGGKLTVYTYFINLIIIAIAASIYNSVLVSVTIELGDNSEPLYLFLIISLVAESFGNYKGSQLLIKYEELYAMKISYYYLAASCIPFLFYNENNHSFFKYLALVAVSLLNVCNNTVQSCVPDYFPRSFYIKVFCGSTILMRFAIICVPFLFTFFKFSVHTHYIGILGIFALLFTRIIPKLVEEPNAEKNFSSRISEVGFRESYLSY